MNTVHLADCLPAMREMEDNAFDLAVVDPPYGIDSPNMNMGAERNTTTFYERKPWDKDKPTAVYFSELMRVSINQIIWGGNYFNLPPTKGFLVWDKKLGDNDFAMCEFAWMSIQRSSKLFSMCGTHLTQGKRIHPTQKPIELYRWIFSKYAKPEYKILDTHVGSGSSRIAAHDAGLDFTGYEIDKDYWEAQEARFQEHIKQDELFDRGEIFEAVAGDS